MRKDSRSLSKIDRKTLEIIMDFKRRIEREIGIRVDEIILFGSRARGDYRVDSDIDLIIVSKEWSGTILERMGLLYRLWNYDIDATLIPLRPDELGEKVRKSIMFRDASRYWIRIKVNNQ